MKYNISQNGAECVVTITGSLGASDQAEYKSLIETCASSKATTYRLDLAGMDTIDSTGLGLLLMLQDAAKSSNAKVILCNAQDGPKSAFDLAHFSELFTIE